MILLQNLENTDWSKLGGCYDTAENVPDLLNKLAFGEEQAQEAALTEICNNYFHQGTRYDGTVAIIPFMFQILEHNVYNKPSEIIDALLSFGIGLMYLPDQYDIEWEKTVYDSRGKQGTGSTCFTEIKQRSNRFSRFLSTEWDLETRRSAAFALVHFVDTPSNYINQFIQLLSDESDTLHRSNLLLCLGVLAKQANKQLPQALWTTLFTNKNPKLVRLSAAIAHINVLGKQSHDEAVQIIIDALNENWQFPECSKSYLWWNDGDMLGYGAQMLPLVSMKFKRHSISALCHALCAHNSRTRSIPKTLVTLILPIPTLTTAQTLDVYEREAIKTLLESGRVQDYQIPYLFTPSDLQWTEAKLLAKQIIEEIVSPLT